jgi:hypothetical protein
MLVSLGRPGYDLIFSCLAPVVDNLMRATAAADAAFAANVAAGVCPDPDEGKAAAAALLVGAAPGDITITASTAVRAAAWCSTCLVSVV